MTTLDNDAVGRTQKQTLPNLRQIGFAYDANSNVTGITPPGRPQHTFAYNAVDRLSTYTPPAVSGVSAPQTGYAYNLDQQSNLVTRPDGLTVTPPTTASPAVSITSTRPTEATSTPGLPAAACRN